MDPLRSTFKVNTAQVPVISSGKSPYVLELHESGKVEILEPHMPKDVHVIKVDTLTLTAQQDLCQLFRLPNDEIMSVSASIPEIPMKAGDVAEKVEECATGPIVLVNHTDRDPLIGTTSTNAVAKLKITTIKKGLNRKQPPIEIISKIYSAVQKTDKVTTTKVVQNPNSPLPNQEVDKTEKMDVDVDRKTVKPEKVDKGINEKSKLIPLNKNDCPLSVPMIPLEEDDDDDDPDVEHPDWDLDEDDELYQAYLTKPDNKTSICILCYEWFDDIPELDKHLRSIHENSMILYGCKYCGMRFWASFLRQRHEKLHKQLIVR